MAFGLHGQAEGAADADVYAIQGHLDPNGPMPVTPAPVGYAVHADARCLALSLPSPVNTTVAGFVDLSGDETGPCLGVSGGGTLDVAECTTGLISANWQLDEPTTGTAAGFVATGVMIGGVAVMAAPPTMGFGYTDDGVTGPGAMVGLIVPDLTRSATLCGPLTQFLMTAVVAGAY